MHSARAVAQALGVGTSTISEWRRAGMPCEVGKSRRDGGTYDLREIIAWRERRNQQSGKAPSYDGNGGNGSDIDEEDRSNWDFNRWLKEERKYKALLLEMKHDLETGELLRKADVEQASIKKIMTVKQGLLGLGAKLAPQLYGLEPNEIKRRIDEEVRIMIGNFARGRDHASHAGEGLPHGEAGKRLKGKVNGYERQ